jgi:hypothetical protein
LDKKSLLFGIVTLLFGLWVFLEGPIIARGAPISKGTGTLISLFGIGVSSVAVFGRKTFQQYQKAKMKCIDCGEEYQKRNIQISICPKCKGKLVDIKKQ